MDVYEIFKRDHARMTDLFDKLAGTSEGALKTRERLFEQLITEISAHKAVVEGRLYPILSKHKETRDLKPTAREINQIERQLDQVGRVAKDDPEFRQNVRELKKTMERQLREEERHIVPALKKALEPDEFKELAKELTEGKREELQDTRQRNEAAMGPASEAEERPRLREVGRESEKAAQQTLHQMMDTGKTAPRTLSASRDTISK